MRRAVAWCGLGALACSAPQSSSQATVAAEPTPLEVARGLAERIEREVDCATSDVRFVCDLQDLPGEDFVVPKTPHAWIGLMFALRPSRTVEGGTRETLLLSRMTLGEAGAWVERIDQSGTAASLELPTVRLEAVHAANGERPDIPVSLVLMGELDTLPAVPATPVERTEAGWIVQGERRAGLWRVSGDHGRAPAWIVVEPVDHGGAGAFVHVFPDVPRVLPSAGAGP